MDTADLRRAPVAVLGLDTTTGVPPLITEVAVIYLDGGVISAGPFAYQVASDAPMRQIRHQSWPQARLAPAWPQVAEQVQLALSDRALVTHDARRTGPHAGTAMADRLSLPKSWSASATPQAGLRV